MGSGEIGGVAVAVGGQAPACFVRLAGGTSFGARVVTRPRAPQSVKLGPKVEIPVMGVKEQVLFE